MSFGYSVGDLIAILKLADDLKKCFSQAPQQFKAISDEVKRVWIVLHDLSDLPDDGLSKEQRQDIQIILDGCREVLKDVKVKLDKSDILAYKTTHWKSWARKAWSRITWDQVEIDRLRDRITSTISLFNLLMNKINMSLSLDMRDRSQTSYQQFREFREFYESKDLEWISPIDSSKRYLEVLRTRHAGTGTWFLKNDEVQKWRDNDKQVLYCPGIPGAGKTVMSSIVIEWLAESFANENNIVTTYFFFDFRQQLGVYEIFAALLRQIWEGAPKKAYGWSQKIPPREEAMKLEWIQEELETRLSEFDRSFIVLDALDECSVAGQTMRQALEFLFCLQRKVNVNILATSRFNEEFASLFNKNGAIVEIEANEEDTMAYIDHRAAYFSPFVARKNGLLTYIRDEIVKSSRGMFLLAKLYLNLLQGEINEKRIRKAIERFKSGSDAYDDAYDETMRRIEQQGQYAQEIAKTIFGWIMFSTRGLSVPEIQHALAIEISESVFDETNIIDVEELMSICIGLITIDAQSNSFKFVHYTTKEYFDRKLNVWFPDIHRVITSACLAYISLDVFNQGPCETREGLDDRLSEYPFYKYSAQNWGHHYKDHPGDESLTIEFLTTEGKVHASCQVIFGSSVDRNTHIYKEEKWGSGLSKTKLHAIKTKEPLEGAHLAAFFGLKTPLETMLSSKMIEVDIQDHAGRSPLSWVIAYGHIELANMLLQNGANPDSTNHFGFTPLFYAAVSGQVEAIQNLIKAGAQVDKLDQNGRGPLFHAAAGNSSHLMPFAFEGDCLASFELLLAHGASATQVDLFGETPLFAAASNGRESVVKLLIERDAHLEYAKSPDLGKLDPLAYAAMNGHSMTAKLFFEAGAHSMSTKSGTNASLYVKLVNLLRAGSEGQIYDFQVLKNEGADPNIRDSYQRLPLHFATLNGDENLVKCLLANGADVNAKEVFGRTPIFYSIFGGQYSTALLLLDYPGIDFQCTDIFGYTPLKQSYKRRHCGDQWKLHNLLKIKSGDYDGLLYNTEFHHTPQSPLSTVCDACRQFEMCYSYCKSCTTTSPKIYLPDNMAKYCQYCIPGGEECACPLCGNALQKRGFGKWQASEYAELPVVPLEDIETRLSGSDKHMFLRFIRSMLKWLPEERKTAEELLDDPWLNDRTE